MSLQEKSHANYTNLGLLASAVTWCAASGWNGWVGGVVVGGNGRYLLFGM